MTHHPAKALLQAFQRAARPDNELTSRAMFGGILAYASGKPAASLSDMRLALKLGGAARDELIAAGGAPLRYEPDTSASKSYTLVPDA
jgi:TfoX/Sxy family transcriptional regulator of competence genes